jgi:hypothetical protein
MVAPLPELDARLYFDASERSFRYISLGVDNRNPARLDGMLELLMATGLRNLEPAVVFEPANDFPAVHRRILPSQEYTFRIHLSMTGNALRENAHEQV